jgi:hypothetical protein
LNYVTVQGVVNGQLRSVCHSTLAVQRHFGRTERHNCPESVEHDLSFAEFYTGIDNALRNKSSITENSWFATNFGNYHGDVLCIKPFDRIKMKI